MAIVHIVLVQFKADLSKSQVLDICNSFVNLKNTAVRADTQQPYIQNITGGRNISPEGFDQGLTHAFTVIFGSVEDRDYYIKEDLVHAAFAKSLGGAMEKIVVVDYEPESF